MIRRKRSRAAAPVADASARVCDRPNCGNAGDYRAPRSPQDLRRYYWFCLDHIREYNRAWNYYAGMTEDEIEAHKRADVIGWRPVWPMSGDGAPAARHSAADMRDYLDILAAAGIKADRAHADTGANTGRDRASRPKEARALAVMEMERPVTLAQLRRRYVELVKLHHPDANGGDKESEERIREINQAYDTLCGQFAR